MIDAPGDIPPSFVRGSFVDLDLSRVPDAYRGVFRTAQERVNGVIRTRKRPVPVGGDIVETGIVITAAVIPIDGVGMILGQAGPTHVLEADLLPVLGTMEFDVTDLDALEQAGSLQDVITHEMLHVIGSGTLWEFKGVLEGAGSARPKFVGRLAVEEYRRLAQGEPAYIPVEEDGGPGTRDAHWDERIFGDELMTGFISGRRRPLSRMSIAALADLGYEVDLSQADEYELPPAPALSALLAAATTLKLRVPPFQVVDHL